MDSERSGKRSSRSPRPKGLSCAECRRLKIKCDRTVPCSGCIKRGYPHLCPDKTHVGTKHLLQERDHLVERVRALENMVRTGPSMEDPQTLAGWPPPPSILAMHHNPDPDPYYEDSMRAPGSSSSPFRRNMSYDLTSTIDPNLDHPQMHPSEPHELEGESSGTLVSIYDRRYHYYGPSAGMQWLREDQHRKSSPAPIDLSPSGQGAARKQDTNSFAVLPIPADWTYTTLRAQLPEYTLAISLTEAFYERAGWLGTPITKEDFAEVLERVYSDDTQGETGERESLRCLEVALVAAGLALGTAVDMEMPPLDLQAARLVILAQQCLISGRYMAINSLTCLEALSLIAKALTYVDLYMRWDVAWQFLGVAQRLIQAMGLHRDGHRWGLDARQVDQRRRIFWDIYITDVFMTANWDRLSCPRRDEFDTQFPNSWADSPFHSVLARFALLTKDALDLTHKVTAPSYSSISEIWRQICAQENEIPFPLRCRASMMAMASKFATPNEAADSSPPPDRQDQTLVLQQHYLAAQSCAAVCLLLRPYFVAALRESPDDPTNSSQAGPFLAVFERSSMILAAVKSLQTLLPLTSLRHWFFWSHAFTAATCLGVVVIVSPTCSLVPLAMRHFESLLALLPRLQAHLPRETFRRDIDWMQNLYDKARRSSESAHHMDGRSHPRDRNPPGSVRSRPEAEEELQMVGWRTRLIKRAKHGDVVGITPESDVNDQKGPLNDLNLWFDQMSPQTAWHDQQARQTGPESMDWLQQILSTTGMENSAALNERGQESNDLWLY